ncbi:MAG TPA: hypothetical protein VFR47_05320 [Anaerolineales bacterium]|nr:hypothetical protein [Anaerolineales bacterium]
MKRLIKTGLSLMLALAFVFPTGFAVLAEEITCRGSMGAVTVDNLRVPQNASCKLNGTRVQGTIKVENGASLTANKVTVIGNIQAEVSKLCRAARQRLTRCRSRAISFSTPTSAL